MERNEVALRIVAYNSAIGACGNGFHWKNALEILATMGRGEAAPDAVAYSPAISACGC